VAEWRVGDGLITTPTGRQLRPQLRVPGSFNLANATCALAAADALAVPVDVAIEAMEQVSAPAGRFAEARFGATMARLMLAKNPAGWAEMLALAGDQPLVLAIDSALADGEDVSWLWDVDFEQLAGRRVICSGRRAQDLAVRLSYANVDHDIVPELIPAITAHTGAVDVMSTYTPFQDLLLKAGLR
jgi:UDP-N-acetylmuramyl tripeptide synthase